MKSKTTGRLKVVIDTNTIISALFSTDGNPARIFELLLLEEITNFTSEAIIAEVREVFRRNRIKKCISEEKISFIIDNYIRYSKEVKPQFKLDIITKDPDDNRILECAQAAGAGYIISGNDHLKELKRYHNIMIMSPKEFMEFYQSYLRG